MERVTEETLERIKKGLQEIVDLPVDDPDYPITHGEISRRIGVGRTTLWRAREHDPEIAALVDLADRNAVEEWGQSMLKKRIRAESDAALIYFQKVKGKRWGWSERQEITGAEGGPVNITLSWPEDGAD